MFNFKKKIIIMISLILLLVSSIFIYNHYYLENIYESDTNKENETNDTKGSTGGNSSVIVPPDYADKNTPTWNATLSDNLAGTPVIGADGNIYVPNGQYVYCYYSNGTLKWNFTTQWGYFHELAIYNNNLLFAPASRDTLYILNINDGGTDYKLLESLKDLYLSNKSYAPEFDIEYLRASIDNVSMGAYNLFGEQWDENTDTSTGYEGTNMVDFVTFNDSITYIVPTDDIIIVKVNSKNRNLFIKSTFTSDSGHSFICFGKIITANLQCIYNEETGMYIQDNNYTLNIKEQNYE